MRLFRPSLLMPFLYPDAIFRIKKREKVLYLTFDDGPDPSSTPYLLYVLEKYDIRALFFCSGSSVEKYPELVKRIVSQGHKIGNHGYYHPDGWKTSTVKYLADIEKSASLTSYKLFRPPFGHLTVSQYKRLIETYKIVFWDIMAYDFDIKFGGRGSLKILKKLLRPGSIIVLHDKYGSTLNSFIEEFIIFSMTKGYRFNEPAELLS
jgi:peptidoglycan-N-acetylglucosamine deacetylase